MKEVLQHNFVSEKPTSLFTTFIVDDETNAKIIEEIKSSGDKQDYKTNVKAYMTDWQMKDKPGFDVLEKKILEVSAFLSAKYYNRPDTKLRVDNFWGMIYKKGDYARVHDHWPALWSGVYYIKAPKGGGDIEFPQLKQKITPKDNMMIIFDGYTRHGVTENLSNEERIAVSFNVKETI
tara:strand:- start:1741 stop:2274 length:534 start_codon:yes stop_codon:yes gene_type:complete